MVREHSKLASEKPGWQLVHEKGQRYGPWALPAVGHSGPATEKGSMGRGWEKGLGSGWASNGWEGD